MHIVELIRQRAKDLMANVKHDNAILGDYVQLVRYWLFVNCQEYTQLVDQDTKAAAEKVRKLRQNLNSINDEIKALEKEHQSQVDYVSSQKRLVNVIFFLWFVNI